MTRQAPKLTPTSTGEKQVVPVKGRAVLVIHGGAGNLTRNRYSPDLQQKYHAALKVALEAGHAVLAAGGCALDAVEAAIVSMEDNPLFNAGRGAVLTREGKVELEASIMVSHPGAAGCPSGDPTRRVTAVTMLQHVKNPIALAKQLYLANEDTPHVLHAAPHAEVLAKKFGCTMVEEDYFHTEARDRQFASADVADYAGVADGDGDAKGTVGAVALDVNGYLAVGTSTGGKGGKLSGRIGDTPIPGAGYWCEQFVVQKKSVWQSILPFLGSVRNNIGMAISGTGDGDFFLRYSVCHDIYERMKFQGKSLDRAGTEVLAELAQNGGEGGVIGLTAEGEIVMGMNCAGMFRGWIDLSENIPRVGIFCDDRVH